MSNPNYFAIIPANVRYCNIEANAKLLYGEITALTSKEGFCYANNKYFADLYKVNDRSIQRWLQSLVENEFLRINFEDYKRKIYLVEGGQNCRGGVTKLSGGGDKIVAYNNTINNTNNTSSLVSSEEEEKKEKKDDEFIVNYEELKLFVNRGKMELEYPWKNFDDTLSDLFLWYEEKGKRIKKVNTMLIVSKWFKGRDAKKLEEEKTAWNNSKNKRNYIINDPQKQEIEENKKMRIEAEQFLKQCDLLIREEILEMAHKKAMDIARGNEKIALSLEKGIMYKVAYEYSKKNNFKNLYERK